MASIRVSNRHSVHPSIWLNACSLDAAVWTLRSGRCSLDAAVWTLRSGRCGLDAECLISSRVTLMLLIHGPR